MLYEVITSAIGSRLALEALSLLCRIRRLNTKIAEGLTNTATILGDLTNLASEFNSELAAIVGTAAELAGSMANVAVALATNNPVAIFSASVQMAVTLTGVVKRLKGEEQERMSVLEQQAHQLEIQQRLINDIIAKLESMHGTDKINQYQKGINRNNFV